MLDNVIEEDREKSSEQAEAVSESISLCDFMLGLIANITLDTQGANSDSVEESYLRNYLAVSPNNPDIKTQYNNIIKHAAKSDHPLLTMAYHLMLSDYEILTVALLLAVEKNAMIGRCIAYIQSPIAGSRPTLGLLDSILSQFEQTDRVTASSILLSGRAVEIGLIRILNANVTIPEQTLGLPTPLIIALQGLEAKWPKSRMQVIKRIELPASILEEIKKQATILYQKSDQVLVIRSGSSIEAENIAALIAQIRFQKPLFVEDTTDNLAGLAGYLYLYAATPVFEYDLGPNDNQHIPTIPGYSGPMIIISSQEGVLEYPQGTMLTWITDKPLRHERLELWQKQLPQGAEYQELANEHLHSASRITELSQLAMRIAESDHRSRVEKKDLHRATLLNEGSGLGSLAQLVTNRIPGNALVLGKNTKSELKLLATRCKHRETLSDNLGVTLRSRYQSGVRSLLVGPSGTGKTLAASWLATMLNLPLYRVDLASVSSKYIGETEKNLSRLLNKAEQEEVILLFDEADSMFGKRTEINDANDRFANAQTNYLLQRIETYSGIVLMTSNSRSRFDAAFTRRIDMIIEFQIPKPEERRQLWRCHLGEEHSLTHTQLNQLSAVADLCGGNIRNIVLTASLLAINENRTIQYNDLKEGIKTEYRKLGKKIPVEFTKA